MYDMQNQGVIQELLGYVVNHWVSKNAKSSVKMLSTRNHSMWLFCYGGCHPGGMWTWEMTGVYKYFWAYKSSSLAWTKTLPVPYSLLNTMWQMKSPKKHSSIFALSGQKAQGGWKLVVMITDILFVLVCPKRWNICSQSIKLWHVRKHVDIHSGTPFKPFKIFFF